MIPFLIALLNILLVVSSLFLICLVLIQRGKGGGLAGAFGAPGGSSAFGTKAGDVFTRITIVTAGVWFLLAILQVLLVSRTTGSTAATNLLPSASQAAPAPVPGESSPVSPSSESPAVRTTPPTSTPIPASQPATTPPPVGGSPAGPGTGFGAGATSAPATPPAAPAGTSR